MTYLDFTIWLTDPAEVKLQQAMPPRAERVDGSIGELTGLQAVQQGFGMVQQFGAIFTSPMNAAALFGCQIYIPTVPLVAPGITSEWITGSGANFPIDERVFERTVGGWFGIGWLFGDTTLYRWRGTFSYKPLGPIVEDVDVTPVDMPIRRWIDGFEVSTTFQHLSRDASRHADGLGLKAVNSSTVSVSHNLNENDSAVSTHLSWERFYIRRRGYPTSAMAFWWLNSTPAEEIVMKLLPTGQILVGIGEGSAFVPTATIAEELPEGEWVKVDLIIALRTGAQFSVYYNGALQLNMSGLGAILEGGAVVHASSEIGVGLNDDSSSLALDFDDWFNAAPPTSYENIDWLNGTKITKPQSAAFGSEDTGNFVAPSVAMANRRIASATRPDLITNATASAVLDVRQDDTKYTVERGAFGPVSVLAAVYAQRVSGTGANDYALGYRIAGAASVFGAAHTHTGGGTYSRKSMMYQPPTQADPSLNEFHPLHVTFRNESGGGAGTTSIGAIWTEVELCGVFDQCDISAASVLSPEELAILGNTGHHNSPYPDSIWARKGPGPISPVAIKSGTFTGNGTSQIITFNFPVTWLFIRNTGSTSRGAHWWSSMVAAHDGDSLATYESQVIDLRQVDDGAMAEGDQEYRYELTVCGADAQDNAAAATFWYVAFCDPGMRFSLNLAMHTWRPNVAGEVTALLNPLFTPQCLFAQAEATGNTTTGLKSYKGLSQLTGGEITRAGIGISANGLSVAAGEITIGSDWITLLAGLLEHSIAAWRLDDGSEDPGIPAVLQLVTWVGDGAASRTISFPRPSGKRPLFAIIWPNSNASVLFRDPQNTGTTSYVSTSSTSSANASTGITSGGIDQFTVGTVGNANGVTYNAFILPGSDVAGNNGWSGDGEFIPVAPAVPPDWPFGPTVPDLPDDDDPDEPDWYPGDGDPGGGGTDPGGGGEPDGEDFGEQCVDQSTKVCQQALSHIGITVLISDITTDDTPEATLCRLHYSDAVAESLREYPWSWATKYADLVHVAGSEEEGSEANEDWYYAWRVPTDCLFERRLVRPGIGRQWDHDPPPFRRGASDTTGRLLFSSYRDPRSTDDDPEVQLEYTFRSSCAAGQGDVLYRQALAWLLASKLAPALSRNKMTAADCWGMFLHCLTRAATIDARSQAQSQGGESASWTRDRE